MTLRRREHPLPSLVPLRASRADAPNRTDTADVIEIATYLLQLGDASNLESLRVLVTTPWRGTPLLMAGLQDHLTEANLDLATMAEWQSALGLTNPPADR